MLLPMLRLRLRPRLQTGPRVRLTQKRTLSRRLGLRLVLGLLRILVRTLPRRLLRPSTRIGVQLQRRKQLRINRAIWDEHKGERKFDYGCECCIGYWHGCHSTLMRMPICIRIRMPIPRPTCIIVFARALVPYSCSDTHLHSYPVYLICIMQYPFSY